MSKRFKIYSAPRADDGRYRFSWDERMYIKEFPDLPSMLQFWQDMILPTSCTRFGMRYELSMTEFSGADWDFIDDPRYADHPVLNGTRIGQRRTHLRSPGHFLVDPLKAASKTRTKVQYTTACMLDNFRSVSNRLDTIWSGRVSAQTDVLLPQMDVLFTPYAKSLSAPIFSP